MYRYSDIRFFQQYARSEFLTLLAKARIISYNETAIKDPVDCTQKQSVLDCQTEVDFRNWKRITIHFLRFRQNTCKNRSIIRRRAQDLLMRTVWSQLFTCFCISSVTSTPGLSGNGRTRLSIPSHCWAHMLPVNERTTTSALARQNHNHWMNSWPFVKLRPGRGSYTSPSTVPKSAQWASHTSVFFRVTTDQCSVLTFDVTHTHRRK